MTINLGFPHRLKVKRQQARTAPPTGSQDSDGVWVPTATPDDPTTVIYDDLADVQDGGVIVTRDQTGQPTEVDDAKAFLYDESLIGNILVDDLAEITWEDQTVTQARITRVIRFEGSLGLKNL